MNARYEVQSLRDRAAKQLDSDKNEMLMHQNIAASLQIKIEESVLKIASYDAALGAMPSDPA